jgi:hypothetical protein
MWLSFVYPWLILPFLKKKMFISWAKLGGLFLFWSCLANIKATSNFLLVEICSRIAATGGEGGLN